MTEQSRYTDLADLPEDQRIAAIAKAVIAGGATAAVVVDDWPGKPERYARKLEGLGCQVLSQAPGPIPGVITLKVGPHVH